MDRFIGIASVLAFSFLTLTNGNVARAQNAGALGAPTGEVITAPPTEQASVVAEDDETVPPPTSSETVLPPPPTVELVPAPPGTYQATIVPRIDVRPLRRQREGGYMPSWEFLAPGLAAFVSTYGGAVYAAAQFDMYGAGSEVTNWLYAPVIGPFVAAGYFEQPGDIAVFTVLGLFQTASLGFIVTGLAINRRAPHENDVAINITPLLGPGQAGVAAIGRF